jgi:hypothetical protein
VLGVESDPRAVRVGPLDLSLVLVRDADHERGTSSATLFDVNKII